MTIYYEATLKDNGKLLQANKLVPFITSMLTLTLAMNVLTTCTWSCCSVLKYLRD